MHGSAAGVDPQRNVHGHKFASGEVCLAGDRQFARRDREIAAETVARQNDVDPAAGVA
jgi:hypothetical protein